MLSPRAVFEFLGAQGIRFFAGTPDSLLKDFCAYVTDHATPSRHVITANEGNAIALAAGHFLGTGEPALVYMQNSGLGNAVNPLLSLADAEVYGIPMVLMIGWRGEPGVKDEPQHVKQGRVMTGMLDAMEIPWFVLDAGTESPESVLGEALAVTRKNMAPVAVLIRKGAFETYKLSKTLSTNFALDREAAIRGIVDILGREDVVVSTTGMASRELYEYRAARGDGHGNDFLTVGAMGHTASIALGLALARPDRRVICLDGDGSVIMHMGALGVIGRSGCPNLLHIVINNGAHDSVGGQPTVGLEVDLVQIALACGYRQARRVETIDGIHDAFRGLGDAPGPAFLEVRVNKGSRPDLGRPKSTPVENRDALMRALRGVAPE